MTNTHLKKDLSMSIAKRDMNSEFISSLSDIMGTFYKDSAHSANLISNISNELLTNGYKYSKGNTDLKITSFLNDDNKLCMIVENESTAKQSKRLLKFINTLYKCDDYDKMYCERMESISLMDDTESSQIGIVSLINMYNCIVDVRLEDVGGHHLVTTTITINV